MSIIQITTAVTLAEYEKRKISATSTASERLAKNGVVFVVDTTLADVTIEFPSDFDGVSTIIRRGPNKVFYTGATFESGSAPANGVLDKNNQVRTFAGDGTSTEVIDGGSASGAVYVLDRSNSNKGVAPTAVEVIEPTNGDLARVYLSDKTVEMWRYGSTWTLLKTEIAIPNALIPNGGWNANTNTPDLNINTQRSNGTGGTFIYLISDTGTQDLGNGSKLYEKGGTITFFDNSTFKYDEPAKILTPHTFASLTAMAAAGVEPTNAEVLAFASGLSIQNTHIYWNGTNTDGPATHIWHIDANNHIILLYRDIKDSIFIGLTALAAADSMNPTISEISTYATSNNIRGRHAYYTKSDNSSLIPEYVYFIDDSGNVLQIEKPVADPSNHLFISSTALSFANSENPTKSEVDLFLSAGNYKNMHAFYTGTTNSGDTRQFVWAVDNAGSSELVYRNTHSKFIQSFTISDFVSSKITILSTLHKRGSAPLIQIFDSSGKFTLTDSLNVNSTGDVEIAVTSGDEFDGKLIII